MTKGCRGINESTNVYPLFSYNPQRRGEEATKKGLRANIAKRSPKDHRRNNKLECVNALKNA